MVEALFRQDEPDADDVAGRGLFVCDVLPQRRQGRWDRRAAKSRGEDARKTDRGFFRPQRQAARGRPDGARSDAGAGQDAGRVEISLGLLQDPGENFRRGSVRATRYRVLAGEEVAAPLSRTRCGAAWRCTAEPGPYQTPDMSWPGLTRPSIFFQRFLRNGWMRGSSPRMTNSSLLRPRLCSAPRRKEAARCAASGERFTLPPRSP